MSKLSTGHQLIVMNREKTTEGRAEYRVRIKVRNNLLLHAIEACGYKPGNKLAEKVKISYVFLNDLIHLRLSPLDRRGELRPSVVRLCSLLRISPFDVFSVEQLTALPQSTAELEMSSIDVSSILSAPLLISSLPTPEELYSQKEIARRVKEVLDTLTPREQKMLTLRFGLDGADSHTYDEMSKIYDVGIERIRQIEAKALRKLAHPLRAHYLLDEPHEDVINHPEKFFSSTKLNKRAIAEAKAAEETVMSNRPYRGICPVCNRDVMLGKTGFIVPHGPSRTCAGVGKMPAKITRLYHGEIP